MSTENPLDIPDGALRGSEIVLRQYWDQDGNEQISVVMANGGQRIGLTNMLGILERAKFGLVFQHGEDEDEDG